jgi:hypothetical protein
MIRRPISDMLAPKVLADIKFTTIRDNPWPVGVPIMLYRWSGKPYKSKQIEVCPIEVITTQVVDIFHRPDGTMAYLGSITWELWRSEGFESQEQMDAWFRPLVKPGQMMTKNMMHFRRIEA